MSSATGRSPLQAAPIAAPMNADSESGVSMMRSPCLTERPLVTPRGPPQASSSPGLPVPPEMSSPMQMTVGSRAISWSKASLTASFMLRLRAICCLLSGPPEGRASRFRMPRRQAYEM